MVTFHLFCSDTSFEHPSGREAPMAATKAGHSGLVKESQAAMKAACSGLVKDTSTSSAR